MHRDFACRAGNGSTRTNLAQALKACRQLRPGAIPKLARRAVAFHTAMPAYWQVHIFWRAPLARTAFWMRKSSFLCGNRADWFGARRALFEENVSAEADQDTSTSQSCQRRATKQGRTMSSPTQTPSPNPASPSGAAPAAPAAAPVQTSSPWLKFGTPILVLILAAAVVITTTRNWNSWEGGHAEQVTDDAYVRGDVTPLRHKGGRHRARRKGRRLPACA